MFPNQPQPPQSPPSGPAPASTPLDYLNQIAPQAPQKQPFKLTPKILIILGGILVIIVIVFSIVINAVVSSQRHPLEQLAARLASTQTIVKDTEPNLKSSQLRSLNSNLGIYLTNTNRDISEPLLSAGVDSAKLSKTVLDEESAADVTNRLEDARLNAILDRTYAREMAYRLDTILTLMKQIYSSTGNSKLKVFLTSAYDNLKPTQEALAEYEGTSQ